MRFGRGTAAGIVASSLTACALFTDVSGFSNGKDSADAGDDRTIDTTTIDADVDSGVTTNIDASFDAPPDAPSFRDEFSRADDYDLANGWTEKSPDAYAILGGAVVKSKSGTEYRDNLVTRPAAEDRADVEVAATFTLGLANAYPQVFARAQRDTVTTPNGYDAYIFFMSSPTVANLARQRGTDGETELAKVTFASPVGSSARVRLTLRVYGEAPSIIEAFVDRVDGPSGATRIGETKVSDGSPDRLEAPGTMGFTASFEGVPAIDDFEWRALGTR